MNSKGKVLVAMSGGIDSTITAMLLQKEGYDIVGITMKTWDYANSGGSSKETGCCSLDSINDAREVAVENGFHHFIIDIREEFGNYVIDDFINEYMSGRTPNPCVLCNTHIKWEALLKRADMLGCDFIATGHYAIVHENEGRYYVRRAKDPLKDQSYVLWGLSQECLKRSIFPLGNLTKAEVRKLAYDWGYEELSKKAESYEICFVPDNDYRGFLKRHVDDLENKVSGGKFIDSSGKILGEHKGYPFYTIGQRKGLGIALGEPAYVTQIDPHNNTVMLGNVKDLMRNGMRVGKVNWMKYASVPDGFEALTMVRYHDKGTMAKLTMVNNHVDVEFMADVRGVAPGQSAVFIEDGDIVGGGIIQSSL